MNSLFLISYFHVANHITKKMIYKTYQTERLFLKPTNVEDAPLTLKLLNMPKWLSYIGDRNVHSLEDAENYIRTKMTPQLERLGFGNYTLIRKVDGSKLGCCGLYDREGLEALDIGFALLEKYEGKGYAYEAALCLKNAAFMDFNMQKLGAITVQANKASRKLLEKLGLEFLKMMDINGEELMYYELVNKKY